MDPQASGVTELEPYLDVAGKALDGAHKSGLLKNLFSRFTSRQPEQITQPVDRVEEALAALRENAVETLATISLTVAEAAQILEPDFTLDDLDKVNSTWQRHWTGGASKVGIDDEERRRWWASLLAGEIKQPETFSLRTLAAMETLSAKEARLFTRLCDYVWNPENPVLLLPPGTSALWKPDFSEGALLESAGLVKVNDVGDFKWATIDVGGENEVARRPTPHLYMKFNSDTYVVADIAERKSVKLRCGRLVLTDIGREMYRLTAPNYPQSYRDEILQEWMQPYTVEQLR